MDINEIILMILQGVLVPLIIYGITLLRSYLAAKTESLQVQRAIDQASDAAIKAVSETAQAYVDEMKGTGQWDKDAADEAFKLSLATAKQILGAEGMKLLQTVTGDVEAYLTAAIEDAVRAGK